MLYKVMLQNINGRIDFTYAYRAIHTYEKSCEEAITEYVNGNKIIPFTWIHKKYAESFKKLGINGFQQTIFIKEMSEKQISLEETLKKCAIRKNAQKNGISSAWVEILYSIFESRDVLGEEFHE